MDLYCLKSEGEPVAFYARDPGHIVELVRTYHLQAVAKDNLKRPEAARSAREPIDIAIASHPNLG